MTEFDIASTTFMEWVRLILVEFLVPLGWPAGVFVALILLRKPLVDFIGRLTEVGLYGAKAVPPLQSQEKASDAADKRFTGQPLLDDPSVALWEDNICQQIRNAKVEDAPDIVDRVIRALAHSNRRADFEQIGRLIFGSQVGVLKMMNDNGPQTETQLTTWLELHNSRLRGATSTPFNNWFRFLQDYSLAIPHDGKFEITAIGKQLLDFFYLNGIDESRWL